MRYDIYIEQGKNNCSAYAPILPGCIAIADTVEETVKFMCEAIAFHIEGLREDDIPIPRPRWHESGMVLMELSAYCPDKGNRLRELRRRVQKNCHWSGGVNNLRIGNEC